LSVVKQIIARQRALGWAADSQNQQFVAGDRKNRSIFFTATGFEKKLAKFSIDQRILRSEWVLVGMRSGSGGCTKKRVPPTFCSCRT